MAPRDVFDMGTTPSQATVDSVMFLNRSICARVETYRRTYDEQMALPTPTGDEDDQYYILQPLFRALIIIITTTNYKMENSEEVGRMPVCLVRTGIEDGLSAPISFDSIEGKTPVRQQGSTEVIQTSLETAVDFIMALDARESAAFGLRPDPVAAAAAQRALVLRTTGDETLVGPTSRLVSDEMIARWGRCRPDQHQEHRGMYLEEEREFEYEPERQARRAGTLFTAP